MCLFIIFITLTFTGIYALADTKGYYTYTVTDGEELSFDLSEEKYIDVKYTSNKFYKDDTGFEGVVGSLVNIKEKILQESLSAEDILK